MEHIHLQSQELEIAFDDGTSILIDESAISSMRFESVCDKYSWNQPTRQFNKSTVVKNLKISFELKPMLFRYNYQKANTDIPLEEGKSCIERLKNSDDIRYFHMNSMWFEVPWKRKAVIKKSEGTEIRCYMNQWQRNSTTYNSSGDSWIDIEIGEPDDKIYIYSDNMAK